MEKKLHVAVCGLSFGGCFVGIYRDHPLVGKLSLFDTDPDTLAKVAAHYGVENTYDSFEAILADESVDAVHLVTPIPLHEEMTVRVLEAGKHCACTVPMATTMEGLRRIVDATRRSGKNYMLMETTLYTRQFMFARQMLESGEFGRIQFLRGSHYQDMENWPDYWLGLPPMWYGTHAIAPATVLAGARPLYVHGFGSGTMREELTTRYGNPFPVETATVCYENGLKAEFTRSLFETARVYQEGMFVYGSKASMEWGFADEDDPIITRLVPRNVDRGFETPYGAVKAPAFFANLPEPVRPYTVRGGEFDPTNPQKSLETGASGGHHGSHPHLVHEFLSSIAEGRKPAIDEVLGARINAIGICAHLSALRDGEHIMIPDFAGEAEG